MYVFHTLALQVLSQCGGSPDDSLAIYGMLAAHLVYVFLSDSEFLPPAGSSSTSRCNTSGAGWTPLAEEKWVIVRIECIHVRGGVSPLCGEVWGIGHQGKTQSAYVHYYTVLMIQEVL